MPVIRQEFYSKIDSYIKNTAGYFLFLNPHSVLSYRCQLQL